MNAEPNMSTATEDDGDEILLFGEDESVGCFDEDCEPDWLDEAEVVEEPQIAPQTKLEGSGDIVRLYNRVGGIMEALAAENDLPVACALGVFKTECGPLLHQHRPGAAIIRFENHLLFDLWGKKHPELYDHHWQHERVAPVEGDPVRRWHGHHFRMIEGGRWIESHPKKGSQQVEYWSLAKARELAGDEIALRCISIGGPQLLVRNFAVCGFPSALAMYEAMQGGEENHARAFFEFIKNTTIKRKGRAAYTLLAALRAGDYDGFTFGYNGSGQVPIYSAKTRKNIGEATAILAARAA